MYVKGGFHMKPERLEIRLTTEQKLMLEAWADQAHTSMAKIIESMIAERAENERTKMD